MGEKAYGTSAGYAQIDYTIRTWNNARFKQFRENIIKEITKICKKAQLSFNITWLEPFNANNNDSDAFQQIEKVAEVIGLKFTNLNEPFNFGEDFGLFTDRYKGAMFGLGAGENCPALHTVDYDFPDDLIEIGRDIFIGLVE